jgi:hypothetical protein
MPSVCESAVYAKLAGFKGSVNGLSQRYGLCCRLHRRMVFWNACGVVPQLLLSITEWLNDVLGTCERSKLGLGERQSKHNGQNQNRDFSSPQTQLMLTNEYGCHPPALPRPPGHHPDHPPTNSISVPLQCRISPARLHNQAFTCQNTEDVYLLQKSSLST